MKNKEFYTVEYEHVFYGETEPKSAFAVYFQLESAQEAMMKMIKNGVNVKGMETMTFSTSSAYWECNGSNVFQGWNFEFSTGLWKKLWIIKMC